MDRREDDDGWSQYRSRQRGSRGDWSGPQSHTGVLSRLHAPTGVSVPGTRVSGARGVTVITVVGGTVIVGVVVPVGITWTVTPVVPRTVTVVAIGEADETGQFTRTQPQFFSDSGVGSAEPLQLVDRRAECDFGPVAVIKCLERGGKFRFTLFEKFPLSRVGLPRPTPGCGIDTGFAFSCHH